ncbi:site-specific integrase [Pseudomonas syringae]|uniref:site-specific integrase n=1 Tax=Pseudomonas syringae TaxID=317 RepID=UPI003F75160C
MGRRPNKPGSIARLRERKKKSGTVYYYYDAGGHPRKEIPLGSDYGLAIMKYAEFERDRASSALVASTITFRYVAEKYVVEVVPTKAAATQKDNKRELANLMDFFDDPPGPLDAITPQNVRQYLNWRKSAPVRANREKALLSHIWNFARDMGYTTLANPCAGIRGNKESGRSVYVEDDLFSLVYEKADPGLRDAMDLAYLTGQRVTDTRLLDERDIRGGEIWITQGKTKAKRRIQITGELAELIQRIMSRKATYKVRSTQLIVSSDGRGMTSAMLRNRFDAARTAAGIEKSAFQFRDLRAKAGTDKAESSGDIVKARDQLGHTTVVMTEKYVRARKGKQITPTR